MKAFVISRGIPTEDYPLYGIFEFDQAKALAKSGVDTSMLVIDFRSRNYKRKYGLLSYKKDDVNIFELSLPLNLYRRALPLLERLLLFLYRKAVKEVGKPDVIHAHFYSIAAIASVIKRKFNIPFVITEHSSKLNKDISLISELDKKLTIKAYSKADCVIAVSKVLSDNIKDNFNFNASVIHDVVDLNSYSYVQRNKTEDFTFISVGNLIPVKGFDILIKAFGKAFTDEKNVFLNIVGEGAERVHLQSIIDENNLSDRVKLLGQKPRSELFSLMKESNAFVLASNSETFGVVYIEAMACGLPVIATRCGGPEDFVNERNGILVPTDDIDSLADALKEMRLNLSNYDSKSISEECCGLFSPTSIASKIIEKYNEVIQK